MASDGFGDFSLRFQREAYLDGGIKVECGEFTCISSGATITTQVCHTHMQQVFCGMAFGENSQPIRGAPVSVCQGKWIDWTFSDGSTGYAYYIAFGI